MAYQEHYTQQLLDNLRAKLLIMGSKTQQALDDAAIAVLNHDLPRAAAVLDGDTDIDDLENQIDEATLNILARTQPLPAISAFSERRAHGVGSGTHRR